MSDLSYYGEWQKTPLLSHFYSNFGSVGYVSLLVGWSVIAYESASVVLALVLLSLFALAKFIGAVISRSHNLWRVVDSQIEVRRGLMGRRLSTIPFKEIHDIDFTQNVLQRVGGFGTMKLQTSSSEGATESIAGIELETYQEIREQYRNLVIDESLQESTYEEAFSNQLSENDVDVELLKLSFLENLKLSLIRNPIGWFVIAVIVPILGVIWNQASGSNLLQDWFITEVTRLLNQVVELHFQQGWIPWPVIVITDLQKLVAYTFYLIGALLALAVLFLALGAVISLVLHNHFRLELTNGRLRVTTQGILSLDLKTPLQRVQLIQVIENLRHRLLGRKSIYFDSSAANLDRSASLIEGTFGRWIVPLVDESRTKSLCEQLLPEVSFDIPDWRHVDMNGVRRRFKRNLIFVLPLSLLFTVLSLWSLLTIFPFLTLVSRYLSTKYVESIQFHLAEDAIHVKKGWWIRTCTTIPYEKIQGVATKATVFDRLNKMRTLQLDVAAHSGRKYACSLPYLSEQLASEIHLLLSLKAQQRTFEW